VGPKASRGAGEASAHCNLPKNAVKNDRAKGTREGPRGGGDSLKQSQRKNGGGTATGGKAKGPKDASGCRGGNSPAGLRGDIKESGKKRIVALKKKKKKQNKHTTTVQDAERMGLRRGGRFGQPIRQKKLAIPVAKLRSQKKN